MKLCKVIHPDTKTALMTVWFIQLLCNITSAAPRRPCISNCPLEIPADNTPVCEGSDYENLCGENSICGQDVCTRTVCFTTCKCTCSYGTECKRHEAMTYPQPVSRYIYDDFHVWAFHSGERKCVRSPEGANAFQP